MSFSGKVPVSGVEEPTHSMLTASTAGDIPTLQQLLEKSSDESVGCQMTTPRPDTLLERAVAAKQTDMVKFILQSYPSLNLGQSHNVVHAVLDNPDAEILQVLCNHDSGFANFSIDYSIQTLFTEACTKPPEQITSVLNVLLDNGLDVHDGWGPGGGALFAAILGGQSVSIIDRIVAKGGRISGRCVTGAIRRGDKEVVELLFKHKIELSNAVGVNECIEEAKATGDDDIIGIVQSWALTRTVQEAGKDEINSKNKGWQFWKG